MGDYRKSRGYLARKALHSKTPYERVAPRDGEGMEAPPAPSTASLRRGLRIPCRYVTAVSAHPQAVFDTTAPVRTASIVNDTTHPPFRVPQTTSIFPKSLSRGLAVVGPDEAPIGTPILRMVDMAPVASCNRRPTEGFEYDVVIEGEVESSSDSGETRGTLASDVSLQGGTIHARRIVDVGSANMLHCAASADTGALSETNQVRALPAEFVPGPDGGLGPGFDDGEIANDLGGMDDDGPKC